MAFLMNVTSSQITGCSDGLNGKAGEYIRDLSTNADLSFNTQNLSAALKKDSLSFPSSSVTVTSVQHVASGAVKSDETGRA